MKKRIFAMILASIMAVSFAACSNQQENEESSAVSNTESSAASKAESSENSESNSGSESNATVYTADVDLNAIGGAGIEWDYSLKYTSIPNQLISYIGAEDFNQWVQDKSERHTMQSCIEKFNLSKQDLINALNPPETTDNVLTLTLSDIDVLFSGDQAEINRTFAGEYAVLSDKGDIYTVFWLAEHTADDYLAAKLPLNRVETVINQVLEDGGTELPSIANKVKVELTEAYELSSTNSFRGTACYAHSFSYHSISAELINYVGKEKGHTWTRSTADGSNDPYHRIGEDMTILAFIQNFNIPKETFIEVTRSHVTDDFLAQLDMTREAYYEEFGYTDEQIEALYSGDQDRIDRAFCGPMAFVNEADQKVYSIHWLAEHTADDYIATGISPFQIENVLKYYKENSENSEMDDNVEKIRAELKKIKPFSPQLEEINISGVACMAHKVLYHSYSSQLLDHVGYENFEAWGEAMHDKPSEELNIVSFVEYFHIPKETLIAVERANVPTNFEDDGVTVLSLKQIDAIYSGDQRLINETFCGPLAFVNEADGDLYSIYWLAAHTAEDYIAAKLPLDQVEMVISNVDKEGGTDLKALADKVKANLQKAYELEKASAQKK